MAYIKKNKEDVVDDKNEEINPNKQLMAFLKNNKEDHLNFEKEQEKYLVSSSSIALDSMMSGGLSSGVARFCGLAEGGKSSCAYAMMGNFLNGGENRRAIVFKGEGRLSSNIMERCNFRFTTDPNKFENSMCFIYESCIYESCIGLMRELVKNNPSGIKYFFLVDSVDSLNLRDDYDKDLNQAVKVSGGALLSSVFLKKMSLALSRLNHICILISQVRATVNINPYAKTDHKLSNVSGGQALFHYSDWVLEFLPRYKDDIIMEGDKIVGHYCKISVKKSLNERTNTVVRYPIRYGQKNGNSVWVSREIVEIMIPFKMLQRAGPWYNIDENLLIEIKEKNLPIEEKFQGLDSVYKFFDTNIETTKYIYEKLKNILAV